MAQTLPSASNPLRHTARSRKPVSVFSFLKFPSLPSKGSTSVAKQKEQLLEALKPLKRGVNATPEDVAAVERLVKELERRNPTKKPITSQLLNGKWELLYTTSSEILGTRKPALFRPSGPIYQVLDNATLTARNQETAPFFNSVVADLEPVTDKGVKVQFRTFKLFNLLPIQAPPSARGALDVTYLDEELRISRGDKGNLFVLRMADRDEKPE